MAKPLFTLAKIKMFDFVKMELVDFELQKKLLINPLLNFSAHINEDTGEILENKRTAKYSEMKFAIYPSGRIFITGSVHKLYNSLSGIEMNHDVFTYQKLVYIIGFLQSQFHIEPKKAIIRNIEFAFNVDIPEHLQTKRVVRQFLVYKKSQFCKIETKKSNGYGFKCKLNQYEIKIYDKGFQYRLPQKILRFEKKVRTMACEFKKVICLQSLLDKRIWEHCYISLCCTLTDCLILENINLKNLNTKDRQLYYKCANPLNWDYFTKQMRLYYKKRYNAIIEANCDTRTLTLMQNQFAVKYKEMVVS